MGIARSTYYGAPAADRDAEIITRIEAICAEFEAYGYRRVTAELRHQGLFVNSKRVRRLMREHGLSPKQRRRYVATTDSDHDEPIFPNVAADMAPDGRDRLRLPRRDPGCLVAPGCRLRNQPLDRCPSRHRRPERGGSLTGASRRLRAS
jgi:transposase InsO family protein